LLPRRSAANRLSESNLGEAVSLLVRLEGDPRYQFSEVTGVLQRIERIPDAHCVYHIVRRSGEMVSVAEPNVVKVKIIPPGSGPLKIPKSWKMGQG